MEAKDNLTKAQMGEANRLYEDTKQEYESIEEQVDTMDASIETYNRKLTETSMLKQQLENQIALLKEQIHSARMNDEHYANRAQSIERELSEREEQLGTLISDQTRLQAELDSGRKAETLEKENLNKLQSVLQVLVLILKRTRMIFGKFSETVHPQKLRSRSSIL